MKTDYVIGRMLDYRDMDAIINTKEFQDGMKANRENRIKREQDMRKKRLEMASRRTERMERDFCAKLMVSATAACMFTWICAIWIL